MLKNSGILPFVEAPKWLHHRRSYTYGDRHPLVERLGVLPPFQFSRDLDETGFVNATLVRYVDGTEYSIGTELSLTGLLTETVPTAGNETGFEHLSYPGSVALPISGLSEGLHYIRFEDDMGHVFLSEFFSWVNGLENRNDYIKLEWWHNEAIMFSGGQIKYEFPYKNRVWLCTDIGKPEFQTEETVDKRDGVNYAIQTICYKVRRFNFLAPEYLLDSIHLIRAHDAKVITHMGSTIGEGNFDKIFEFLVTPQWSEVGDLASVDCEFRTDRVVIVNGRGYTEIDYDEGDGGCLEETFAATAWIADGSPEEAGGYWTDEFGANHSFINGQYAIEEVGGFNILRQWNGSSFITPTITVGQTVHTVHDSRNPYERFNYYFFKSTSSHLLQAPIVLSESNVGSVYTISGETFESSLIEVWLLTDDDEILAGTFTSDDFFSSIEFDATGSNGYYVRARTYICENLGESDVTTFEGIGWWEIENDFEVQPDPVPPGPDSDDDM